MSNDLWRGASHLQPLLGDVETQSWDQPPTEGRPPHFDCTQNRYDLGIYWQNTVTTHEGVRFIDTYRAST